MDEKFDKYYTNLVRSELSKALVNMQSAQDYLVEANVDEVNFKRFKKIINTVRNFSDLIGELVFNERRQ